MIHQGHVGVYEMIALLTLSGSARIFLSVQQVMAKLGDSAGWMIPLGAALVALLVYFVYSKLLCRFPGQSIISITEAVLGPIIGTPVILLYWLHTMLVGALTARQFAETFITVALPQTPISVLMIVAIAITCYASYLGLESISRTSLLVTPWILLAVAVITYGISSYGDPHYLLPLWGSGIPKLAQQSIVRASLYLEVFVIGIFAPNVRRSETILPIGITSILAISLIISITTASLAVTTSVTGAKEIAYPLYFLARQIYFNRFWQRLEAIFIIIWFIAAVVALFLTFHTAVIIFAQMAKLPFYQPLCFPTSVMMFAMALLPKGFVQARNWDVNFVRPYGSIIYPLLIMTYIIALLRKKGVGHGAKEDAQALGGRRAGGGT